MPKSTSSIHRLNGQRVRDLIALGLCGDSSAGGPQPPERLRRTMAECGADPLPTLLCDLQSPVLTDPPGPLAFERLTGLTHQAARELAGQSFLRALASSQTSRVVLEAMIEYGELLSADLIPAPTRLTGIVVRLLALSALSRGHGVPLDDDDRQALGLILQLLGASQAVPQDLLTM